MRWVIPAMLVGRRQGELAQFLGEGAPVTRVAPAASQDAVWAALSGALRIVDVAAFQRSHGLVADGIVGPRTFAAAVRVFQENSNLLPDGIVGPRTLTVLGL